MYIFHLDVSRPSAPDLTTKLTQLDFKATAAPTHLTDVSVGVFFEQAQHPPTPSSTRGTRNPPLRYPSFPANPGVAQHDTHHNRTTIDRPPRARQTPPHLTLRTPHPPITPDPNPTPNPIQVRAVDDKLHEFTSIFYTIYRWKDERDYQILLDDPNFLEARVIKSVTSLLISF